MKSRVAAAGILLLLFAARWSGTAAAASCEVTPPQEEQRREAPPATPQNAGDNRYYGVERESEANIDEGRRKGYEKQRDEKQEQSPGVPNAGDEKLQVLAEKLQLTLAQRERVRPVLHQEARKIREILLSDLPLNAKRARARAVRDAAEDSLLEALTPLQKKRYSQLKENRREELKKRRLLQPRTAIS